MNTPVEPSKKPQVVLLNDSLKNIRINPREILGQFLNENWGTSEELSEEISGETPQQIYGGILKKRLLKI